MARNRTNTELMKDLIAVKELQSLAVKHAWARHVLEKGLPDKDLLEYEVARAMEEQDAPE